MPENAFVSDPLFRRDVGSTETDFRISEYEEPAAPSEGSRKIAPLHRHRTEDEGWYVLRGRLRFQFGEEQIDAPAGCGVLLSHGVAHTFWNASPEPTRYLIIARPKTVALLLELHRPGATATTTMKELFSRFDVDLLE